MKLPALRGKSRNRKYKPPCLKDKVLPQKKKNREKRAKKSKQVATLLPA
jgi:hypothetical protein